jgi:YVTN family beta-propeller protein
LADPSPHTPYGVAVTLDGSTGFVTNQGADSVSVLDLSGSAPTVKDTVKVGTHPNAALLDPARHKLYVANGDSDQISVLDTSNDQVSATIDLAPYPRANVGTNPVGLSLSPDGRTLYVANSGNNDVDVIDLDGGRVVGSIPTGWYASAVAATDSKLFVASAKGLGAGPNNGPGYPNPTSTTPQDPSQYVGSMIVGTL